MIQSTQARSMAESLWGKGGTHAHRTNRQGAFYFSCSGHGGYIIDWKALTESERIEVNKYLKPEECFVSKDSKGKIRRFHHPYKESKTTTHFGPFEKVFVYVAEEDCDWAIIQKFTKIRRIGDDEEVTSKCAEKTFNSYHNPESEEVKHRIAIQAAREAQSPDLIVSALADNNREFTKVWTADAKQYLVKNYDNARDEFGTPWLSNVEIIHEINHEINHV
jgi:CRISPR/Cas system CSM-associated protein Csm3 (group 7 of RAMP superfamily)